MKGLQSITVRSMLVLLTTFFLVDIAVLAIQGAVQSGKILDTTKTLARVTVPSVREMTLADMMHDGIRANVLNAILAATGNSPTSVDEIRKEGKEFAAAAKESFDKLKNLDLPSEIKAEVIQTSIEFDAYSMSAEAIRNLALNHNLAAAKSEIHTFMKQFEALETTLGKLGEDIEKSSLTLQDETEKHANRNFWQTLTSTLLTLIAGISVSYLIIRRTMVTISDVSGEIYGHSDGVGKAAEKVDASANALASDVQAQSSSLQQTAATVHEISEMARLSADNAGEVRQASISSVEVAVDGKRRVGEMIAAIGGLNQVMTAIQNQVAESNVQFTQVAKVIQEIGSKTQVINEIVFQTKLLSFNASVEAARAGEHGKGFAVVAEEVGNLARSSGAAAEQISKLLTSSRQQVDDTVEDARLKMQKVMEEFSEKLESSRKVANECGGVLDKVVEVSQHVQGKIDQISGAIKEQSAGVSDMSKALEQFGARIANSTKEAAKSADIAGQLRDGSVSLKQSVTEMVRRLGANVLSTMGADNHVAGSAASIVTEENKVEAGETESAGFRDAA